MKKLQILRYICGMMVLAVTFSCNKDFLEKKPLTEFQESDVWKDQGLIQAYVNDLYAQMRPGFNEVMLSSMTDESRFIHDYSTSRVVEGNMTADDMGALDDFSRWKLHYKTIRNCNLFFEKIDSVKGVNADVIKRMKGEVHFMRAWYYHMLVKYFGGVPLITYTFNLEGEHSDYLSVKRAPFTDCVNFVAAECDSAIKYLPDAFKEIDNKGRVTKYAAFALKCRMLLYASSKLYNPTFNTDPKRNNLTLNSSDLSQQYATAAKVAADSVILSGMYSLYQPTGSPVDDYTRIFLDKGNVELIFVKLYDKALLGTSHDKYNGPNGYHNWGGNVPLENFVSGYQMADGTSFSWSNPVMAAHPYRNRDPRFYATILYDSAKWKTRPEDGIKVDPIGLIQTGRYETADGKDSVWGLDTRNSTIENWNGTFSGYYMRKFMDATLDAQFFNGDQSWIWFRYAEILLNHAEADLVLKDYGTARKYINMIRTRAGMPATNLADESLWGVYKYERRYELAYEEHRFFDLRRWNDAPAALSDSARGIDVRGSFVPGHPYKYTVFNMQNRKFKTQNYFAPIPASETRKNVGLEQNPGY
ncbi:RagB/SusD family nutrient uptake outer membrane protein [Chitinophaga sp. Cy-1792]|uniref:RagB/SusD family nutrient uptake outer membrane protein n=1 Tax=Chitinophaga sp. Cy-1792 TaxID=2608339 RepID=UPI001423A6CD|nr:RagB/SusD family nutrient uptake outer membrane protein [Chitinophaga sp. Cy-1792]NIG52352.1 RagB/SusD family nutrient uptake outer membrane protein [Chitinophaga sp. Cy-1792]